MDNEYLATVAAIYLETKSQTKTATRLGVARSTAQEHIKKAGLAGLLGTDPVVPGFRISQISTTEGANGTIKARSIQQKPEHGDTWQLPDGHRLKGISTLVNADGETIVEWRKTVEDTIIERAWRDALDEFKKPLERYEPRNAPHNYFNSALLAQYTITDLHFGMHAWAEETKDADYDLRIAEKLLLDWFSAAIEMAPNARTAVLAQLGDLLHYDSLESVTPASKHIVDADGRAPKMVRVVIRVMRQIMEMLLRKHERVHVIMAKANHDPYSSIWLREIFAALYENEPRVTVDVSPAEYYAYQHGKTALFYHHGHKRNVNNIDSVFVGTFREIWGAAEHAYGHVGHLHSDEVKETNLMRVERHRTLAPSDAYAAGGGWLSKRDAKVIVYHDKFGEVSRLTLSPQMVQQG